MYEYTNPNYYSKVNDFGDNYHKPDSDIDTSGFGKEFMRKLRSLKRKYRDFAEYVEAKEIYNQYAEYLVEKYGGRKQLKFYFQTGLMKEYVPFCPELRYIKKNKKYIKGTPLVEEDTGLIITEHESLDLDNMPAYYAKFFDNAKKGVGIGKLTEETMDEFVRSDLREAINQDLELIDTYYKGRVKHASYISHKARRRAIMAERYKHNDQKPAKQRYKEYLQDKWNYRYEEEKYDPDLYVFYKDVSMTAEESRNLEVYDWLHKHGIRVKKSHLSKGARKVVRRTTVFDGGKKKKKEKGKKKNKNFMKTKYMQDFRGHRYNTFEDFEKDMLKLVSKGER